MAIFCISSLDFSCLNATRNNSYISFLLPPTLVINPAGFMTRVGGRRKEMYELFLVAFKQEKSNEEIQKIAMPFIPKPKINV